MTRHTSMPPRLQKTPHGDVTLTSRWMRDRYYLVATGAPAGLRWLFPRRATEALESISPVTARIVFPPCQQPITVERELRRRCALWQSNWDERLQDEPNSPSVGERPAYQSITTLGQLIDHLQALRKPKIAVITADRDRYRLGLWRTELGSDRLLSCLLPDDIANALLHIGKRTSASTANTSLGVLKTYLTWAANMGLLKDLSHRTVRRLKEPASQRHQRAWWTTDEVDLALRCPAEDPHQPTATLLVAAMFILDIPNNLPIPIQAAFQVG